MECLMAQPSLIGQGWWSIVARPYPMPRSRSPQRLSTERSPPNRRRVLIVEDERRALPACGKRSLPRRAHERTVYEKHAAERHAGASLGG
jgi:hypothetical protein